MIDPTTPCIQFVMDDQNYPLLAMERTEILRQGLKHRSIVLTMYDENEHLILWQRPRFDPIYPGRWDVVGSGPAPIDIAGEDLARTWFPPLDPLPEIRHVQTISASMRTGNAFVEVFTAQLQAPQDVIRRDQAYLAVDQDELSALTKTHPELFTPLLMILWTEGLAFEAGYA